jgi:hypothetical protein
MEIAHHNSQSTSKKELSSSFLNDDGSQAAEAMEYTPSNSSMSNEKKSENLKSFGNPM